MCGALDLTEKFRAEMNRARARMNTCCGPIALNYEPGCTYAYCVDCKRKVVVADWDPEKVATLWNLLGKQNDT